MGCSIRSTYTIAMGCSIRSPYTITMGCTIRSTYITMGCSTSTCSIISSAVGSYVAGCVLSKPIW